MNTTAPDPVVVEQSVSQTTATAPTRVLMVDDEASFTNMVKRALEATGRFEVRTENFALNAVNVARKFQPHVILLDVIMPMTDGGTVSAKFKSDAKLRDTPVIFLTAAISPREAGHRSKSPSGELFLAKPVELEKLIHHIDTALKSAPAQ